MNDFNANVLLEHLMQDRDLALEILRLYIASAADLLANLETAIAGNDVHGISLHAHSLKGSSANVGAEHMCRMAAQLENLATKGDFAAMTELLVRLTSGYQDFLAAARREGWID